jgi:selenium metabolism protein YedF
MNNIDCRGQACPGPVIQVKNALEKARAGEPVSILVDNEAARDNVARFAASRGCKVAIDEDPGSGWTMTINPPEEDRRNEAGAEQGNVVVFIATGTLGQGDDKLGDILMEGFITSLTEQDIIPDAICLMNGGVKLAAEGSPLTDVLDDLVNLGCELLVCGTCLEFFDIKDKLLVGTVSNMYDIQERLLNAGSVIRP